MWWLAGGEDADRRGDYIRDAVAAPPRHARLQHRGRPRPVGGLHGSLVPHVRQNLHLHQQVGSKQNMV